MRRTIPASLLVLPLALAACSSGGGGNDDVAVVGDPTTIDGGVDTGIGDTTDDTGTDDGGAVADPGGGGTTGDTGGDAGDSDTGLDRNLGGSGGPVITSDTPSTLLADNTERYDAEGGTVWAMRVGEAPAGADLDYVAFGVWRTRGGTSGFVESETVPAPVLPSGTATYAGGALASEDGGDPASGTSRLKADFAAGTLTGGAAFADGLAVDFGTLVIGAGAAFAGDGATSNRDHTGSVDGTFAGPNAEEAGGVFSLNGPSTVRGAFGGVR